ncbi:MAG TPA: hypothetical protein VI603_11530 [Saprospiraceae bacterium]|nr:hypothetical protein [Saprospiraceae bacterium]
MIGIPQSCSSQFGIGGRFTMIQDGYWHEVFALRNAEYSDQLASISGLYWFRLKKKRVEFLPEIGYYNSINNNVGTGPPNNMRAFFLQFNTDIYFLDFGSDCNCPTFSKESDFFKRGLFLEISPGVELGKLGIDYIEDTQLAIREFKHRVLKLYAGLGFDIGLSDLVTVTAIAGFSFLQGTAWDGVEEFLEVDAGSLDQTKRNQDVAMNAGVRILLRPDYIRKRR